ncbi:MAG: OmpA family protein [Bacteroidales bacterium]|nr:OmpA family protein [Bacteroidales bacterium]
MKQKLLLLTILFFAAILSTNAQISLKRVLNNSKERAENKIENRLENKIDNTVDNALDDVEGKNRKDKKKKDKDSEEESNEMIGSDNGGQENQEDNNNQNTTTENNQKQANASPTVVWNKFDFVPGDKIIFEDSPLASEENGEFPSRWDLIQGQVEIGNINGENVLMFLDGGEIIPYMENSSEDYLPEVFTIEFDYYTPKDGNRLSFYLKDKKNQSRNGENVQEFEVTPVRIDAPKLGSVEHPNRDYKYCENGCWVHVSIAYTNGKLKVYLDDTRLVNIPHYEYKPTGFTLYPYFASAKDNKTFYVKNVRIAEGGVKYYDRAMQDGKIVVNGIRFDIGKATLKPESMGPINEIYSLMNKNPEINFSVEGHTDSDGDDATNQKLSEERAKTVMNKLIEMGIDKSRLKSQGFGESKPLNENTSAEGKAQNRRVEFVKF